MIFKCCITKDKCNPRGNNNSFRNTWFSPRNPRGTLHRAMYAARLLRRFESAGNGNAARESENSAHGCSSKPGRRTFPHRGLCGVHPRPAQPSDASALQKTGRPHNSRKKSHRPPAYGRRPVACRSALQGRRSIFASMQGRTERSCYFIAQPAPNSRSRSSAGSAARAWSRRLFTPMKNWRIITTIR